MASTFRSAGSFGFRIRYRLVLFTYGNATCKTLHRRKVCVLDVAQFPCAPLFSSSQQESSSRLFRVPEEASEMILLTAVLFAICGVKRSQKR
jgi:hypothetical protein